MAAVSVLPSPVAISTTTPGLSESGASSAAAPCSWTSYGRSSRARRAASRPSAHTSSTVIAGAPERSFSAPLQQGGVVEPGQRLLEGGGAADHRFVPIEIMDPRSAEPASDR